MRLIDADRLKSAMWDAFGEQSEYFDRGMAKWDSGLWVRYKAVMEVIDSQPTADFRCQRRQGKETGSVKHGPLIDRDVMVTNMRECYGNEGPITDYTYKEFIDELIDEAVYSIPVVIAGEE